ncbi:MAG: hypothetical protein ACE5HN_08645 [Nitrospiria bacterium]
MPIFFLILVVSLCRTSASAYSDLVDQCMGLPGVAGLSVSIYDDCVPNLRHRGTKRISDTTADLCPSLKEILKSGRKEFKSIRGKLDLVSEEFFGTLIPPGQEICFAWLNGAAYHCRSREGLNLSDTGALYDAYNRSIRQCLSDDWAAQEVTIERVNARRFTTYKSASDPIEIKVGEKNRRTGWQVVLSFKR